MGEGGQYVPPPPPPHGWASNEHRLVEGGRWGHGGGVRRWRCSDQAVAPVERPSARRVVHGWSVDGGRGEGVLVGTDAVGKDGLPRQTQKGGGDEREGGGSKTSKRERKRISERREHKAPVVSPGVVSKVENKEEQRGGGRAGSQGGRSTRGDDMGGAGRWSGELRWPSSTRRRRPVRQPA